MHKILIVDDNKDYLELISQFMGDEGYDVDTAVNGREAIQKLEENPDYDLIITDVLMPDIDGFGLIQFINNMDKAIPIIALSGGGFTINSEDVLSTVESLVSIVYQKPVSLAQLVSKATELTKAA
ncbi:MAG: response regulator [Alcanivorax sp.]